MADVTETPQFSFAKGEVSPSVYGRVDTSMYQSALRTARNVVIRAQGGASSRPGLSFIGPVKDHTNDPRLIEFQFNTTDTYWLEFGNFYLRVIRNGGHVTNTPVAIIGMTNANPCVVTTSAPHGLGFNGTAYDEVQINGAVGVLRGAINGVNGRRFNVTVLTSTTFSLQDQASNANINTTAWTAYTSGGSAAQIYTLVSPYAIADTLTMEVTQNADVMTITHPSYPPTQLGRTSSTAWAFTVPSFVPSQPCPTGLTVTTNAHDSKTVRYAVTATKTTTLEESLPALNAASFPVTGITRALPPVVSCTGHNFVLGDEVELDGILGMTQVSGRRFTCANIVPGVSFSLVSESTTPEDSTNYGAFVAGTAPSTDTSTSSVTMALGPLTFTVSASKTYVAGQNIVIQDTAAPGTNFMSGTVTSYAGTTLVVNIISMTGSGTIATWTMTWGGSSQAAQTFVQVTDSAVGSATVTPNDTIGPWDAVPNTAYYSVYIETNGIYGWLGDTDTTTFTNANLAADLTISPPEGANPFLFAGNYPATSGFYKQRQVYGGMNNAPDKSIYSQPSSPLNMSTSSPPVDSDAITASMAAQQVNAIKHFIPCNTDLIVFTAGSEFQVNQGNGIDFSTSTITQNPQSSWGSAYNPPILVNRTILFVPENGAGVRTLAFTWQINGYKGEDAGVLANHLFAYYSIVDWCFAKYPDPIAHIVRADGTMVALTFNEEQSMIAWTHWDTQGSFTRCASMRPQLPAIDESVAFVVRRFINGQTVRYIEQTVGDRFIDGRDCFFVDAGVQYNNPINITNITNASLCVITAPNHGLTSGALVDFYDILWQATFDSMGNSIQPGDIMSDNTIPVPQQLNTMRFTATVIDANTISIPIDSTAFLPYIPGGIKPGSLTGTAGGTLREPATVIENLDHLEGQTVTVLADGNVIQGLTVLNGAITLPRPFSRVTVGFGFTADIETLNVETPGQGGTTQGVLTKIAQVLVRFEQSRGLLIGPDCWNLTEMKQREYELMGDPTALLTGDKLIDIQPSWNSNGRLFLRQKDPLPMTILGVIPRVNVGT